MPSVLALYAGRAGSLVTSAGTVRTAIAKSPVTGRVRVEPDGLAGDEQVSPGHGGPDRALCLYPREHYAHWAARIEPAFGENITSEGALEDGTRIGDVWRIGSALVQVSQPPPQNARSSSRKSVIASLSMMSICAFWSFPA
ncbi:MAG: MOSC domain-containing protein [Solirubrobacteraceae bacterium]